MWISVAFAKIKLVQTGFVCATVVPAFCAYSGDMIDFQTMICLESLAAFSLVMLAVITAFTRRLVGVVSISDDKQWLRLGYMNFWGFRRNAYIPCEDLIPLSELPGVGFKVWARLRRYTKPQWYLYMPITGLDISNEETFEQIFGSLPSGEAVKKLQ